jgi:hypothetical protein
MDVGAWVVATLLYEVGCKSSGSHIMSDFHTQLDLQSWSLCTVLVKIRPEFMKTIYCGCTYSGYIVLPFIVNTLIALMIGLIITYRPFGTLLPIAANPRLEFVSLGSGVLLNLPVAPNR